MAALHEVEEELVGVLAAALYPAGTAAASAVGAPVRVYRGWPDPNRLDADLAAGTLNVSVYPQEAERRTTRYTPDEIDLPHDPPTLTLTAAGDTVTAGGTPCACNAAVAVNGKTYITPVTAQSTLAGVAAALATLINADTPASSSGSVVTVPDTTPVARVGGLGGTVTEIRRQKRGFMVTCWCPSPETRDELASFLDSALAGIDFLPLPDGTAARLLYERTTVSDRAQEEGLYRRDLLYSVEYGTTRSAAAADILAVGIDVREKESRRLITSINL